MDAKTKFKLIGAICDRMEADANFYGYPKDRLSACMDLEYSGVNLDALLKCDNSTFYHDVWGIFANMDRVNKRLGNCFVPRVGFNK